MILCLRRMSFLEVLVSFCDGYDACYYHSVSAFGSSIGTDMRSSFGAADILYE